MVRSRSLVPLTVSLAVISAFACISRRAEACGVAYPPYVTLVDATPADGAVEVVRDGSILIAAKGWHNAAQVEARFVLPKLLNVEVRDRGTQTLAAGAISWWSDEAAPWHPAAPLAARTTYDVTITVANTEPADPAAVGSTTLTRSFTTGDAVLSPLSFGTMPAVVFGPAEHESCPAANIENNCGGCRQLVKQMVPSALIDVAPIVGGDVVPGYAIWVYLDRGSPRPDSHAAFALVDGKNPTRLVIPLFEDEGGSPTAVCLRTKITDAQGHEITTDRVCYTHATAFAKSGAADTAPPPPAASPVDATPDAAASEPADASCGVVRAPGLGNPALPVTALLIATALLGTRRRQPRAAEPER